MCSSTHPSNSALNGGGWPMPRPDRFTRKNDAVPIVNRRLGDPHIRPGRVRKLSLIGIRPPDSPARSVVVIPTMLSGPSFLLITDFITCILHTNL